MIPCAHATRARMVAVGGERRRCWLAWCRAWQATRWVVPASRIHPCSRNSSYPAHGHTAQWPGLVVAPIQAATTRVEGPAPRTPQGCRTQLWTIEISRDLFPCPQVCTAAVVAQRSSSTLPSVEHQPDQTERRPGNRNLSLSAAWPVVPSSNAGLPQPAARKRAAAFDSPRAKPHGANRNQETTSKTL